MIKAQLKATIVHIILVNTCPVTNIEVKHNVANTNQNIINSISHHQLKCFSLIDIIITANFQNAIIAKKQVKNILMSAVPVIKLSPIKSFNCNVANNIPDTISNAPIHRLNIPSAHK